MAIERYNPVGNGMAPRPDGRWVTFEDHQRLLRAVEEERERECDLKLHAEQDARIEHEKREAAESKLQEVIQELEKDLVDDEETWRLGDYLRGRQDGFKRALHLLRAKGTEQGGGDADANGETRSASVRRHVAEAGVAVEGDASLLDQALAALDEIAGRPTVERNPDGDDQAAEVMALLAREHAERIRWLRGEGDPGLEQLLGWVKEEADAAAELFRKARTDEDRIGVLIHGEAMRTLDRIVRQFHELQGERGEA